MAGSRKEMWMKVLGHLTKATEEIKSFHSANGTRPVVAESSRLWDNWLGRLILSKLGVPPLAARDIDGRLLLDLQYFIVNFKRQIAVEVANDISARKAAESVKG